MDGFLSLHKPHGLTSHDCVAKVRRLLKTKKVGHGGTLDPLATGVLPIAIGKATRLLPYLPTDKAYRGRVRLGVRTNTDDLEGEVISSGDASHLQLADVAALLPSFTGNIWQIPPAFSAIQVNGQRLYKLARAGEEVIVPSREVYVDSINILEWFPGEFPEVNLEIVCGTGTYIRAIARDLGEKLGTGATLAGLLRTRSCGLDLSVSKSLADLEASVAAGSYQPIDCGLLLNHLPQIELPEELVADWYCGKPISLKIIAPNLDLLEDTIVAVFEANKSCLGIGKISHREDIFLQPKTVLSK
jgi:tRNA pseudouridine55 synthase